MSLPSAVSSVSYTLSASAASLAVPFYFFLDTDLVVTRTRGTVTTTLTLDSDYTVTGAGVAAGGAVAVTGQAVGDVILIARTVPLTQERTFTPLTKLSETNIEAALDKAMMGLQQLKRELDTKGSGGGVEEAPEDGTPYARQDGAWVGTIDGDTLAVCLLIAALTGAGYLYRNDEGAWELRSGGSGGAVWGEIDGTLTDQLDLVSALAAKVNTSRTVNGHALSSDVTVSKSDVDLGNCDNTSDANKPISSATQTALDGKQPLDADLTAIAALLGTSGLLKKTATNTWTLDTSTYLTGNQNVTISGDATGSGTTTIALTLANTAVTAGSYGGASETLTITADAKGRITSIAANDIAIANTQVSGLGGAATLNVGTTTGTVAAGDDSRLSNSRAPTAHASSHGSGQSDAITIAESQVTNLTTDLAAKAADSAVVHNTGTETIAGVKTFSSQPIHSAATASTVPYYDSSKQLQSSTTTPTELSYVHGLTSAAQTQLDAKAPLASPTFTGTPAAPTASVGTSSTQLATTAFVQGEKASPLNDQSGTTYTFVASDAYKTIRSTGSSAASFTVGANVHSAGQSFIVSQTGSGQVTLVAGSGMTLNKAAATLKTRAQYSRIAVCFNSATDATVVGDLAAS